MGWGEFFALSSALVWALAVILMRRSGETLPPFELNLVKNTLGFGLMLPTILVFYGMVFPPYTLWEITVVVLSGVVGIALADTWYLKALNLMGAGRTGIVASLFSPFVILLSAVLLEERMSAWQWVGFVLVLAGVLLVTWRVHRTGLEAADVRKGAFYGVSSVFFMAIGVVMIKETLETRPFLWTVELRLAGGMLGLLVYMQARGLWRDVRASFRRPQPWGTVLLASILGAYLGLLLWLAGYRMIDASVAAIFNQTNVAFIVLLAWLMLGEKINLRKLAGILLTLAGVIVMIELES